MDRRAFLQNSSHRCAPIESVMALHDACQLR
jgi:hypothetical protein